jgi:hypothetical protein
MPEQETKLMPPFEEVAKTNRTMIKGLALAVKAMHQHDQFLMYDPRKPDFEEMHANITLAYRHLEDAAMRLGKAIQAFDGGVSIYDK